MSRPMLLVFVLLVLIMVSQFEWREHFASDADKNTGASKKEEHISNRDEGVKEKIILSQEKNIQRLNEFVRALKEELQLCRSCNETSK